MAGARACVTGPASRCHHLGVLVELGEDQAAAGRDGLAGLQAAGDDDEIAVLLGDRDLPALELVMPLVLAASSLHEDVFVAVDHDHRQAGNDRLPLHRRDLEDRP